MRKMLVGPPVLAVTLVALTLFPRPAHAFSASDAVPDDATLAQMDQRAQQADPRERCFLYTELAHFYTVAAGRQLAQGDLDHAADTLRRVEHYGQLIHSNLVADAKKLKNLKNAEMLMHETTYRLGEYLHLVSSDDKVEVQAALKQMDKVNDELLTQVFAH
jgi:hypothetical protein